MYNMKKKLIIIIPIIAIVLIAIIITILYFTTDLFKSNEELFWKYFSQAEDITKIIDNDKGEAQENFKQTNSYTGNGEISFVLTQGENSSKQFNAVTTSRHDAINNRTYSDITLKNGELDIFKVSYINSGDIYGIKCDEIFGSYVGIQNSNLTELGKNYGIENIPNSIDKNEYTNLLELTDAQKQYLIDIYLPIVKKYIPKDQYKKVKENIDIDGVSYTVNVYKIELTGDSLKSILEECLNTLRTDTETLMIVSEKMSKLGFGTENTDTANIISKIDEIIGKLQSNPIQDSLTISVYENDGNNICTQINFGNKISAVYERVNNISRLSMDISYEKETAESNDEIIDLNALVDNNNITSRIIIEKNINENTTTNNIQIVPDIQNSEENINISLNLSTVQNDNINNSYAIVLNQFEDDKKNTTTINYNNNIVKTDTVEEIEELSGSNTAIANNYTKDQFTVFIKNWSNIFIDKLSEKMATLGLEEITNELDKVNIE